MGVPEAAVLSRIRAAIPGRISSSRTKYWSRGNHPEYLVQEPFMERR